MNQENKVRYAYGEVPTQMPEKRDAMVVGMAYVPIQRFTDMFDPDNGFPKGTVFPELEKPFLAGGMVHG